MNARPGGEADKFGNRYEGAWTIYHLLLVLAGRADAVTVEDVGEKGEGSEFTLSRGGRDEAHQVKLGNGNANGWTLKSLETKGVLKAARSHVEQGRQFHFVSAIPAPILDKLASRARQSASLDAFLTEPDWLTKDLQPEFNYLSGTVYKSDEVTWRTLRGIWVRTQDEEALRLMNDTLAELLLEGAPPRPTALSLGDLAITPPAIRLDAVGIEARLPEYGLRRAQRVGSPSITQTVATSLSSWKASIERELLEPTIERSESTALAEALRSSAGQLTVVVGTAGAGKSAVLHQTVQRIEADSWTVLGFRLDRIEAFASTADLGERLGLGMSPVTALAAAAGERPCLLVIDQLDAVSLASGRMPLRFDTVADLIREAEAFPQMRVLLGCRAFDVDNDHRIRQLVAAEGVTRFEVLPLTDDQVDAAVQGMGLAADQLTTPQRSLLRLPLNLVLLSAIADQQDALAFTSATGLLNSYWERKRRDCASRRQPPPRFTPVIVALANAMSARQQLTASISVLDAEDLANDAEVLVSEHVLVQEGKRYAFFHETFFDYAFARLWVNRDQSLTEFLLADEQELFRRAQVRQILLYLRDDDPERFVRETEGVLAHPDIRFHIKAVVLSLLRSVPDPSPAEWHMVERLAAAGGPLASNLWQVVKALRWFDRMDAEGAFAEWLASGDDTVRTRVMEVVPSAAKQRADRLAELIAPYAGNTPPYINWLMWISRFANVHESRPLFDLILDAVRRGDYNKREGALWSAVHNLGQFQPTWAIELLTAWLVDRPEALALDRIGRVAALESREHDQVDLARQGADRAPAEFCRALVPYMLQVMSLTEGDTSRHPITDRQFPFRYQNPGPLADLGDALLYGAANGLRALAAQDPDAIRPMLELLARDQHDSAQWLLYEALRSAGEYYADWAAELLLEGNHRFYSGYSSNMLWTARQFVEATTPHMSDELLRRLETAVLEAHPEWEDRQQAGYTAFALLSAMPEERLSEPARRRLGELRRRFGQDQPAVPTDITGGTVDSPIPEAAAERMNDDQWLGAMRRHNIDRTDFDTMTGGSHELSQVLRVQAMSDPGRFARLTQRLTPDIAPEYGSAILQALGQADQPVEPALVFDAIRHIASLNNPEHDQSLGMALWKQLDSEIPDDIIEILLGRALHAANPTEEVWARQASSGQYYFNGDIQMNGINTARGQAAVMLGDLIAHDKDGHRTELVAPWLGQLAGDPSVAVRSSVAHLLAACLRHANAEATAAFGTLIATDDRLLATPYVERLAVYIGREDPTVFKPVVRRMLASSDANVREVGGRLAAWAGLEFGLPQLLTETRESSDVSIRKGAATVCAQNLAYTSDPLAADAALRQFITDSEAEVRKAAAQVAASLRGRELRPFGDLLIALIASEAFDEALPQLLLTVTNAPDRIDDIVIACTGRFIALHGPEIGDISTSAAGEARDVVQLTLRAYAQASSQNMRRQILDFIDSLLQFNAFGATEAVDQAER